jgi:hypothetical protein
MQSPRDLDQESREFICEAARFLEHPPAWVRAASVLGAPMEKGLMRLPAPMRNTITSVTGRALQKALELALVSLPEELGVKADSLQKARENSRWLRARHGASTFLSGALGGSMGWAGLMIELPLTTSLMLRGIAATARDFGMDLESEEVRLECLSILSLGSPSPSDDALETSYYEARFALKSATDAALAYLQKHSTKQAMESLAKKGAAPLLRLLTAIGERFEILVSEKALAESLPLVGALGGGTLNLLFTEHFNRVAFYHFGLRKLERSLGEERVREFYRQSCEGETRNSGPTDSDP